MTRPILKSLIAGIALASISTTAAAQDSTHLGTLPQGTWIRFREDGKWVKARLVSYSSDTVRFSRLDDSTATSSMAITGFDRLEYSSGKKSKAGTGALIGGLVGAAFGLTAAIVASSSSGMFADLDAEDFAQVTVVTGAAGAVVGVGIGAAIRPERWHAVNPPARVQPKITPTPFGVGAGVAIRF